MVLYMWLVQMNAFVDYAVLTSNFLDECGGLEEVVDEVYQQHSWHDKKIGESVMERLFSRLQCMALKALLSKFIKRISTQSNFTIHWNVVHAGVITSWQWK